MTIQVVCASCSRQLKAPEAAAGKVLKCPKCQQPVRVPGGAVTAKPPTAIKTPDKSRPPAGAKERPQTPKASRPVAPAPDRPAPDSAGHESLEKLWRSSSLFGRRSAFTVKRKVFSLWTLQLYFLDPAEGKETIGWAKYKRGLGRVMLETIRVSFLFPIWCEITDEEGNTLFWLRQKWQWFSLYTRIDIFDPDRKEVIAYFKIKIFSLYGGLMVFDADHQQIGDVKPNFGLLGVHVKGELPMFQFLDQENQRLGFISSEHDFKYAKSGKAPGVIATLTVGDLGYSSALTAAVSDQPRLKVLLLAATLVMKVWGVGKRVFDPMAK